MPGGDDSRLLRFGLLQVILGCPGVISTRGLRMKMLRYVSILVLVASGITAAQDPKKPQEPAAHPGVDQKRVNRAIHKGIEFLKTAESPGHNASKTADELLLLTFVHAGAETSPRFKELFEKMMQGPLEATYNVALQAMILEEL